MNECDFDGVMSCSVLSPANSTPLGGNTAKYSPSIPSIGGKDNSAPGIRQRVLLGAHLYLRRDDHTRRKCCSTSSRNSNDQSLLWWSVIPMPSMPASLIFLTTFSAISTDGG